MKYWKAAEKAAIYLKNRNFSDALTHYDIALGGLPEDESRRYAQVSIYLGKALSYLGLKDAQSALDTLATLEKARPAQRGGSLPEADPGRKVSAGKCPIRGPADRLQALPPPSKPAPDLIRGAGQAAAGDRQWQLWIPAFGAVTK